MWSAAEIVYIVHNWAYIYAYIRNRDLSSHLMAQHVAMADSFVDKAL